jgi:hypothetical protein
MLVIVTEIACRNCEHRAGFDPLGSTLRLFLDFRADKLQELCEEQLKVYEVYYLAVLLRTPIFLELLDQLSRQSVCFFSVCFSSFHNGESSIRQM